ncbi:MAG: alpha/beta hydrolase, partial [bacterium]|nr:alpha/beta hydrolase [bacterium]
MTEWFTTSDGVRLAYHQLGAGDPPVVFIHGGFGNRTGFTLQEEYFSPNHRCLAIDLRGRGESDKPDELYTMDKHADELAEWLRHMGLRRPILVGHSMGGQVVIS